MNAEKEHARVFLVRFCGSLTFYCHALPHSLCSPKFHPLATLPQQQRPSSVSTRGRADQGGVNWGGAGTVFSKNRIGSRKTRRRQGQRQPCHSWHLPCSGTLRTSARNHRVAGAHALQRRHPLAAGKHPYTRTRDLSTEFVQDCGEQGEKKPLDLSPPSRRKMYAREHSNPI